MATEIIEAVVLPTGYLSLAVRVTGYTGDPITGFQVTANDGLDTYTEIVTVATVAGYDATSGVHFLPRVFWLSNNNDNYIVTAQPMAGVALVDLVSAGLLVWPGPFAAPEIVIRQLIADKLTNSPIPLNYDAAEPMWVYSDRMGRPRIATRLSGKPGAAVEVGVPYMTAEDPFENSTDTDTQITVPMRVMIKGDNPDRGEDAVNAAYLVRGVLSEGLGMNGYGICKWTWSGGGPEQEGAGLLIVSMQMTLTRVSDGFCVTPVSDGNIDDVPDFVMDGGEV